MSVSRKDALQKQLLSHEKRFLQARVQDLTYQQFTRADKRTKLRGLQHVRVYQILGTGVNFSDDQ